MQTPRNYGGLSLATSSNFRAQAVVALVDRY